MPLRRVFYVAGVGHDGVEKTEIGEGHKEEQDVIEKQDCDCCAIARSMERSKWFQ